MSERAAKMIEDHEKLEPHESDKSAREAAAARLWAIGDKVSKRAAEQIWQQLGTTPLAIKSFKHLMRRLKKGG